VRRKEKSFVWRVLKNCAPNEDWDLVREALCTLASEKRENKFAKHVLKKWQRLLHITENDDAIFSEFGVCSNKWARSKKLQL
jgi:hypothetical protein